MKRATLNNLGGLQSILFCTGVYLVALFFSIFICTAIFNVFHSKKTVSVETVQESNSNNGEVYASMP